MEFMQAGPKILSDSLMNAWFAVVKEHGSCCETSPAVAQLELQAEQPASEDRIPKDKAQSQVLRRQ